MLNELIKKDIIAIIPVRGGSRRILRKNLVELAGRPLLAHSILHAKQSNYVKKVYVSTEDPEIAHVAKTYNAEVVERPFHLAADNATSESALMHALDSIRKVEGNDPDLVVFLQATSPVRKLSDIDNAIELLYARDGDSLFSAHRNVGLIWGHGDDVYSINYDFKNRKQEQEMDKQYRENGSIYVFKPEILRKYNNRLGGKILIYEMDYWSSFQIDEPEDLELVSWVMQKRAYRPTRPWPKKVELVIFDFDGVMTDNKVIVDEYGKEAVVYDRGDSLGLSRLKEAGIPVCVLSTEKNPVVAVRCRKLDIEYIQGIVDKGSHLKFFLNAKQIRPESVIYIGNDINDLDCFKVVGFNIAVGDAHPTIINEADLILRERGGHGAVREACDVIMENYSKHRS